MPSVAEELVLGGRLRQLALLSTAQHRGLVVYLLVNDSLERAEGGLGDRTDVLVGGLLEELGDHLFLFDRVLAQTTFNARVKLQLVHRQWVLVLGLGCGHVLGILVLLPRLRSTVFQLDLP